MRVYATGQNQQATRIDRLLCRFQVSPDRRDAAVLDSNIRILDPTRGYDTTVADNNIEWLGAHGYSLGSILKICRDVLAFPDRDWPMTMSVYEWATALFCMRDTSRTKGQNIMK